MLAGSADVVAFDHARGWAADLDNPAQKLVVRVMLDDREIARCQANMPRSDLLQFGDGGKLAYEVKYPVVQDVDKLKVYADSKTESLLLNVVETYPYKRGYQTFEDQVGDSNSLEKLKKLGAPDRYDGLSVLDLGCNEGFFCIHALERGAAKVTGIDASADFIAKAKRRNARINYIHGSWWDIPNEKYDIIFFLSAMHYEKNPQGLFDKIAEHLNPGGKLILECGIMNVGGNNGWTCVQRGDGVFRYPSRIYLVDHLLRRYYVRYHEMSVTQGGDPVPRYVFHATLPEPIAIFLPGKPNTGKTILASLLENRKNIITFSIDFWIWQVKCNPSLQPQHSEIYKLMCNDAVCSELNAFIDRLSSQQAELFADAVYNALPMDVDCVIIEGYALGRKDIFTRLKTLLEKSRVRVWQLERI